MVIRMRTANRTDEVELPSLTPIWRAAEFQEREDLRSVRHRVQGASRPARLLMWDEFKDHPMRRGLRQTR